MTSIGMTGKRRNPGHPEIGEELRCDCKRVARPHFRVDIAIAISRQQRLNGPVIRWRTASGITLAQRLDRDIREPMLVEMSAHRPEHVLDGHPVERAHVDGGYGLVRNNHFVCTFRHIARFETRDIELALEASRPYGLTHAFLLETAHAQVDQRALRIEAPDELF